MSEDKPALRIIDTRTPEGRVDWAELKALREAERLPWFLKKHAPAMAARARKQALQEEAQR